MATKLPPVPAEVPADVPPDITANEGDGVDEYGDSTVGGVAAYKAVGEERLGEMEAFAGALYDVKSPTYRKVMASFRLALPEAAKMTERAIKDRANKWMRHPVVRRARERVLLSVDDGGPLSRGMYVRILLDREHKYAERGRLGDAAASVQLFKLIGATLGFTAKKPPVKAGTGPIGELPAGTTADMIAEGLIRAGDRMRRLREENPVTQQLKDGEVAVVPAPAAVAKPVPASEAVRERLEEREYCVNHPDRIAHYQTWKTDSPRCIACLSPSAELASG